MDKESEIVEFSGFFSATFEIKNVVKTREKTREKIIELILSNKSITQIELSEKLEISLKAIEGQLKKLKNENRIKRVGPDKGGHWEVLR
ncbi:MAG: winged helix-turn-helix domain-containing protein [DPANN group archaeon]|nr:winged helix-turn-helix domain-containing protein [DPANN group archaeon]